MTAVIKAFLDVIQEQIVKVVFYNRIILILHFVL